MQRLLSSIKIWLSEHRRIVTTKWPKLCEAGSVMMLGQVCYEHAKKKGLKNISGGEYSCTFILTHANGLQLQSTDVKVDGVHYKCADCNAVIYVPLKALL